MTKIKKVLLLTVDGLTHDSLMRPGRKTKTPTLDFLSSNSIFCTRTFANGNPTQLAFPPVFTSTYPLDYGGFDRGIKFRPKSLPEIMKENGFHTASFATAAGVNEYYSYGRGFDEVYELYDIKRFWRVVNKVYLNYYLELMEKGEISRSQFQDIVLDNFLEAFEYIIHFCKKKIHEEELKVFPKNPVIEKYDYPVLCALFESEVETLRKSRVDYFAQYNAVYERVWDFFSQARNTDYEESVFDRTLDYVAGEYLKEVSLQWILENKEKNFFLWVHYMDPHERNYTSDEKKLKQSVFWKKVLKRLRGKNERFDRFVKQRQFDKSVAYVDKQISGILSMLKKENILDETLIIIASDHGSAIKHADRKEHRALLFYEEYVRVPLIFYNPGVTPELVSSLCENLDIAPTILDLLDIPQELSFKGVPVYSKNAKERDTVILENAGRGPSDLRRKNINICVRSERYKYIYKEGLENELYDIQDDKLEQENRAGSDEHQEVENKLRAVAEKHLASRKKVDMACSV